MQSHDYKDCTVFLRQTLTRSRGSMQNHAAVEAPWFSLGRLLLRCSLGTQIVQFRPHGHPSMIRRHSPWLCLAVSERDIVVIGTMQICSRVLGRAWIFCYLCYSCLCAPQTQLNAEPVIPRGQLC